MPVPHCAQFVILNLSKRETQSNPVLATFSTIFGYVGIADQVSANDSVWTGKFSDAESHSSHSVVQVRFRAVFC